MRKIPIIILLVICVIFSSCSKKLTDQSDITGNISKPFNCEVNIKYGDIAAKATVNKLAVGVFDDYADSAGIHCGNEISG